MPVMRQTRAIDAIRTSPMTANGPTAMSCVNELCRFYQPALFIAGGQKVRTDTTGAHISHPKIVDAARSSR